MADRPAPAVADLFAGRGLTLIAGPCVIESYELCAQVASRARELCARHGLGYVFKASFDKANRTSVEGYRGPGLQAGLAILERVRAAEGVPVLTDVHLPEQAAAAAEVVDVLQIPAFLCRQTDLLWAAGATGKPTNVKKGQFLAPEDMAHAVEKVRRAGGGQAPVAVTERGTSFGYRDLVVDMRSLPRLAAATGAPVIFDATHSVQRPGAAGGSTGGDRSMAPVLARAAVAVGVAGLFCEVHPDPDRARSDGPNSLTFALLEQVVREAAAIAGALQGG